MSTMDHTPKSGFLADRDDLSWLTVEPVPEARREIHPRFRTNWAAITVVLFALMLGLLFGIGIGAGIVLDTVQQHSSSNVPAGLPACETEDSTGCYWDAETQGNGAGIDLVTP